MIVRWLLTRGTLEVRELVGWGISSARRNLVNQGIDTLELGFGGADLLGNAPFEYGETLQLDRVTGAGLGGDDDSTTTIFRGRVVDQIRGALGGREGLTIVAAGAWWHLANLVYMQSAAFVTNLVPTGTGTATDPVTYATATKTTSSIQFRQEPGDALVDNIDVVTAALQYAIAKGAPFALGTIDAGISIPRDSIQDTTCAEVISRALRWTPDRVVWFDYSVAPPTINIRTAAHRTALALDLTDEEIAEVEINPRRDLVVSGVTLNYLRRHQRTDLELVTLDKEQAGPDPEGIGALVATLELYGSYLVGTVVVAQEEAPTGLAASLYAAYSAVPWEGRVVRVQEECETLAWTSRKLSIANAVPAWQTAEMLVQQSSDDLFSGRTELIVGPPRQLGAQDLLGLVRKGRTPFISVLASIPSPVLPVPPLPTFPPATTTDPRLVFGAFPPDIILRTHTISRPVGPGGAHDHGGFTADTVRLWNTRGGTIVDSFDANGGTHPLWPSQGPGYKIAWNGLVLGKAAGETIVIGPGVDSYFPAYLQFDVYANEPGVIEQTVIPAN